MKNTVIYIGRKNGSQYHIRQFSLGRIYHKHKTRNVKALKQTKRQYQVLYCGIRGQGVLTIYLFGFLLIPIPVQCVAVRWGQ
jgi:hypothetical protein